MSDHFKILARALPALLLASCNGAAPVPGGETLFVQEAMAGPVNSHILAIWNIGNDAMDDQGGIDPAMMDDGKWAQLGDAAGHLENAATAMANAATIRAANGANTPENEAAPGAVAMADVQRFLDANPQGFRDLAAKMGINAGNLRVAAGARDAQSSANLIEQINADCEACHSQFWYPES